MTAARDNTSKPELSEVFWFDLEYLADHIQQGRDKYPDVDGVPNFILGGKPDKEYEDCIARHLKKVKQGEWADDEGFVHMAAIAWNALAWLTLNHPYGVDEVEEEEEEEEATHQRVVFEGEEGILKPRDDWSSVVFYADGGRKVPMSSAHWQEALDQNVARILVGD